MNPTNSLHLVAAIYFEFQLFSFLTFPTHGGLSFNIPIADTSDHGRLVLS